MRTEVIVWACLAAGLVAAEVIAPGVFLLWLGVAAGAVLAIVLLFPGIPLLWQAVAFVAFSLALIPAYRHFFRTGHESSDQPLLNRRAAQLIGQVVPLESQIQSGRGRVKIGDAFWMVSGPDLPAGTRVRITGVDSMILAVEPE
jgi:membrane protein implicated in regulation of membrane protease activity